MVVKLHHGRLTADFAVVSALAWPAIVHRRSTSDVPVRSARTFVRIRRSGRTVASGGTRAVLWVQSVAVQRDGTLGLTVAVMARFAGTGRYFVTQTCYQYQTLPLHAGSNLPSPPPRFPVLPLFLLVLGQNVTNKKVQFNVNVHSMDKNVQLFDQCPDIRVSVSDTGYSAL